MVSGSPPFGYTTEQDDRGIWLLKINEEEARIVRLIYDLYVNGEDGEKPLSISSIARYLTDLGILTPSAWRGTNNAQKKAAPNRWNGEIVRRMLINETYAGTWHFGKQDKSNGQSRPRDKSEWIPVEIPSIVTRELWNKVQDQRKSNMHFSPRNTKHKYLLRKRIRCGRCGATMRAYCKAETEKYTYTYYMCSRRSRPMHYADSDCDARLFRVDAVDATAWNWISTLLENPELLNRGLNEYIDRQDRELAPLKDRLSVINGLLEANNEKLERLMDLYILGDLDRGGMKSRKSGLIAEENILVAERQRLETRTASATINQKQIDSLKEFASQVSEGLAFAADDFEIRDQIINHLNVSASVIRENDIPMLDIECVLGGEVLPIATQTTNYSYPSRGQRQ